MTWIEVSDCIASIAGLASAVGVFMAYWQLRHMKQIAVTDFEDGLSKEYRELCGRLPTKAILGQELTEEEHRKALDEFIHYFDLCNEQAFLRIQGRVSEATWTSWRDGIRSSLELPAFARAWKIVKDCSRNFSELRRLETERFQVDPANW